MRAALRIPLEKTKTVGQLQKEDPKQVEWIVLGELVMFCDVLGGTTGATMTPAKALNIARLFAKTEELKHIRAEELAMFFRDAFAFKYGKIYGAFGWETLAEWWRLFWDERITTAEELSIEDHLARVKPDRVTPRKNNAEILTTEDILKIKLAGK